MNPNILVTGGTGLLGTHMLRELLKSGYTHITATYTQDGSNIPADLRESIQWKKLVLPDVQDCYDVIAGQDWVIHTAGLVSYERSDRYRLLEVNQHGTEQLINASLENGVKHFIYVGSIGALGKEKDHITLDETNGWLQNKYSTAYGLSKYLGELEAWRGGAEGLPVSVVLPSVMLGQGDWKRSSLQLIDRVVNHAPWYPGGATGFVDVRDVCRFIVLLLKENKTGERWLLNGANWTYEKMYRELAKALGVKKHFREAPMWGAKINLIFSAMGKGRLKAPDLVEQIYGSFAYDARKSLSVEGFEYREMGETVRGIVY